MALSLHMSPHCLENMKNIVKPRWRNMFTCIKGLVNNSTLGLRFARFIVYVGEYMIVHFRACFSEHFCIAGSVCMMLLGKWPPGFLPFV